MKLFYKVESFFQKHIEGFFDKKFSSSVQPVEIAKKMVRIMENECTVGVSRVYIPNRYHVLLSRKDYDKLMPYQDTVIDELGKYLLKQAVSKDYTTTGNLEIKFSAEPSLEAGAFKIEWGYSSPIGVEEKEEAAPHVNSDTIIFAKVIAKPKRQVNLEGLLTVVEGLDNGLAVDMNANRINIGRRESNEMPLTDMNTSRLHSYIVYEEGAHVIYDAKSLNGTYINGHRITRKRLQSGDRIKLGNTVILYEVR